MSTYQDEKADPDVGQEDDGDDEDTDDADAKVSPELKGDHFVGLPSGVHLGTSSYFN